MTKNSEYINPHFKKYAKKSLKGGKKNEKRSKKI